MPELLAPAEHAARPTTYLDDDPGRVDLDLLHSWLSEQAYWARGRSRETVRRSLTESWSVAAFDASHGGDTMVGFARLVSDRATYAWLCDVFVDPAARGQGIGRRLLERCVRQADLWGVRRTVLATKDAHEFYRPFGFTAAGGPFLQRWLHAGSARPT